MLRRRALSLLVARRRSGRAPLARGRSSGRTCPERIERRLASPDPARRSAAPRELVDARRGPRDAARSPRARGRRRRRPDRRGGRCDPPPHRRGHRRRACRGSEAPSPRSARRRATSHAPSPIRARCRRSHARSATPRRRCARPRRTRSGPTPATRDAVSATPRQARRREPRRCAASSRSRWHGSATGGPSCPWWGRSRIRCPRCARRWLGPWVTWATRGRRKRCSCSFATT